MIKDYISLCRGYLLAYSWILELLLITFIVSRFKSLNVWLIILIVIILFAVLRIIMNRDILMYNMRELEKQIWGKPLDREEWKNDKPKGFKKLRKTSESHS